jgi:STE24 endopeptidase
MYLFVIVAYGLLFWASDQAARWLIVGEQDVVLTLCITLLPGPLAVLHAWRRARRALVTLREQPEHAALLQQRLHRLQTTMRVLLTAGFAASLFLTRWPDWFAFGRVSPVLQIFGDLIVLLPFMAGMTALWLVLYPFERALRARALARQRFSDDALPEERLRLRTFLASFLRNQLLVFAAPLTCILFVANLTNGYKGVLQDWTGWVWTPDAVLGVGAFGVFLVAPLMLRRIWSTVSMPPGPLRDELEELCKRIDLRFRDILIWRTGGTVINAAVMGLIPSLRYVMLSDGLLEAMPREQVVAVFGHEAGHVRHRHMQFFLLFALAGWLMATGVIELLLQVTSGPAGPTEHAFIVAQAVGLAVTTLVWGVGFGWVSRRFERQADLFGAACAAPLDGRACLEPCAAHLASSDPLLKSDRPCATGVALFIAALDRVAWLNGIPHEEHSWRHSSIGSRMRFLARLAGDPRQAHKFDQLVERVKQGLMVISLVGTLIMMIYLIIVQEPALLKAVQ